MTRSTSLFDQLKRLVRGIVLWRLVGRKPSALITDLKISGPLSDGMTATVTCWADGDEHRKQTVFVMANQRPLQLHPKVKEL